MPTPEDLSDNRRNAFAPANVGGAVVPSDSDTKEDNFPVMTRGIYVGGTGNLVVVLKNDTEITFNAVPIGTLIPISCKRVATASTTTLMTWIG